MKMGEEMRRIVVVVCLALIACGGGSSGTGSGGRGGTTGVAGSTGVAGTTGGGGTTGVAGTTGAGGVTGAAGATGAGGAGNSFEPMSVGARWVYATTEPADGGVGTIASTKTVIVEAYEPVPTRAGIMAWRIYTEVPGLEDQLTWQNETATAIGRYRDEIFVPGAPRTSCATVSASGCVFSATYAPFRGRIDTRPERLMTGAEYLESFTEMVTELQSGAPSSSTSSKPFVWKVVNGAESVTTPAGTFTAVHLQKFNGVSMALDKDYWFARGVGKVKETSNQGRVELLMSYTFP
jgi:hypothetical protein